MQLEFDSSWNHTKRHFVIRNEQLESKKLDIYDVLRLLATSGSFEESLICGFLARIEPASVIHLSACVL